MIYRRKTYQVDSSIIEEFNRHFNRTLLPTQLKYGSRLVGRWMTEDKNGTTEVFAMWEYKNYEQYERIENDVRSDQEHVNRVQQWYQKMGGRENVKKEFLSIKQDFLTSTVPAEKTLAK